LTLTSPWGSINWGFRIFAVEESLDTIPARRYRLRGQAPSLMTVFLHAQILHPGEFDPRTRVMIKIETELFEKSEIWNLTFDRQDIPHSFSTVLLGTLLQNTEKNIPLLICPSSDFLSLALFKEPRTDVLMGHHGFVLSIGIPLINTATLSSRPRK
jgi:hypothetical protein